MKRAFWFLALLSGAARADFLDEFNRSVLDPRWRILWEDPTHWSLTARPGFLRIITKYCEADTMWNEFYHVEAISGNFEVSVKLIARPDSAGQLAGIYADYDSMLIGMPRAAAGIVNMPPFGCVVFGMINGSSNGLPYSDTLVYLRIRTNGNTAFAEYSPDNSSWTALEAGGPFPEHQVSGVMAMISPDFGGTRQTPPMNADFDWYHLVAVTGIEEENQKSRIKDQKYRITPNPFRDRVTITLNSADQAISGSVGGVSGHQQSGLNIYDAAGRLVKSFDVTSHVLRPTSFVSWNGTDDQGVDLPAGVYFIRSEERNTPPVRVVKVR